MDYSKLTPKVAEMLASDDTLTDEQIADSLNAATITQTYSRFVTFRTVLSELETPVAMSIIGKARANSTVDTEAAAGVQAIQAVLAEVLPSLEDTAEGCGIDMSNTNARSLVDSMVAAEMLTSDEGAAVKAMAERQVSWATANGITSLRAGHVANARENYQ